VSLNDYGAMEKITGLPRELPIEDAPKGYAPSAGDVAYYAPWGNLAIFRKGGSYAKGLVKLGCVESGFEALTAPGLLEVTIQTTTQRPLPAGATPEPKGK
jgi:hypothetical protein